MTRHTNLGNRLATSIYMWMLRNIAHKRPPNFVIGDPADPLFNIYLHQILRSDDDRALPPPTPCCCWGLS
ncbi:hypothetical protein JN531_012120 [Flagellatimonas centrodinii]|uniref:hypothetical protein n=1 Tax=Flagellatimonas centrodinii TaxID=2806210 RepID=UPI001FEFAD47|nr:hypothetical protein [Flagellatimonas centrodinii]ULQ45846.1 hypothetical protein JN531_012120 [Flagellatimonas centrodinii]